ncbi:MAG TPA: Ig-like domain-containing protein [Gemmatimonadales bacterium]|nr:Ig-like domain-containing protein [Gemmatimonadales bacterium]
MCLTVLLAWAGGCSDSTGTATASLPDDLPALIVSAPIHGTGSNGSIGRSVGGSQVSVVFVSLPPGTIPEGIWATIRNQATRLSITVPVVDGGFDPIAVAAGVGDTLVVDVRRTGSASPIRGWEVVSVRRPPLVVRTNPPPRKADVPLNSVMLIVFSEPMDPATLNPESVQLWHDATRVAGTVRFSDGTGLRAEFHPDVLLTAQIEYRLVLTPAIRDLDGEALPSGVTVPFTTVTTGPLATITVSPNPVTLAANGVQQFTAVGKDAAGNVVPVAPSWSVVAGGGTIDSTGLFVSGDVPGTFLNTVQARSGGITGQATVTVTTRILATINVLPASVWLPINGTQQFYAEGKDGDGNPVAISPTWSVTGGGGSITSSGLFTAGGVPGTFGNTVQASSGSISGHATVSVTTRTLANVIVIPSLAILAGNGTQQFTAVGIDAAGDTVAISPTWRVTGGGGTISSSGLFTAGPVPGFFQWTVQADAEGISGNASVSVTSQPGGELLFAAVTAGGQHTCGLTEGGFAYCWGDNSYGALGNGTRAGSSAPVAVALQRPFYLLRAGGNHTCGTTPSPWVDNYVTYCWGGNASGQLGDGTTLDRTSPQALDSTVIIGAIISSGLEHTCVLDLWAIGWDYCWGANDRGQLDDGTTIGRLNPVSIERVNYTPFEHVTAGGFHTCAEAGGLNYPSFLWYCWGANGNGQLGDGTTTDRLSWVLGGGGMSFAQGGVSAGRQHTCGVTAAGAAYCWGLNSSGQLGDGTTTQRTSPVLVAGGLRFAALSAGDNHTCGITTAGAAYCWGLNSSGQLGDGTTTQRLTPVPVAGGLTFAMSGFPYSGTLSAGRNHTCGVTTGAAVYCWGANDHGQLGNGSTLDSAVPVRVTRQP